MNRKLFVISVLLVFGVACRGQYSTVITQDACFLSGFKNDIVRNWQGTKYAITYSEGNGGVFRVIDYGDYISGAPSLIFPLREVAIPVQVDYITDVRIFNGIACFCGYKRTNTAPYNSDWYIGCFKMSELVAGMSVNYWLIHIDQAVNLWKIEGFNDGYGFRVYALGLNAEWTGSYWWERHGVFEVIDPPSATSYNFALVNAVHNQPYHEFLDDIVVLDEDIVFVGRDNNSITYTLLPPYTSFPSPAISMRKVRKSQGLADPHLDDNHHFFVIPGVIENNSSIQAKSLSNNQFAIVYTHSELDNSRRRIRVFDNGLNNINSQEYALDNKLAMKEMTYNEGNKVLSILEPWNGTTRFFFASPLNTVIYTALTLYDPLEEHLSLDTISKTQIISTMGKRWTMQYANQISYNPLVLANNCLSDGAQEVDIISPMDEAVAIDPPTMGTGGLSFIDVQPVVSCNINEDCSSE